MFNRLGHLATTRSRLVLALAGLGIVLAALAGIHAPSKLKSSGFVSANAPSQLAQNRLDSQFAGGSPNLILLVQARSGGVDQPAVAAAGRSIDTLVAATPGVTNVSSYWTTGSAALRSRSGTEALIVAHVAGNDTVLKDRTNAVVAEVDHATKPGGPSHGARRRPRRSQQRHRHPGHQRSERGGVDRHPADPYPAHPGVWQRGGRRPAGQRSAWFRSWPPWLSCGSSAA